MNRYEILIGKDPPPSGDFKERIRGIDVGKGDSTRGIDVGKGDSTSVISLVTLDPMTGERIFGAPGAVPSIGSTDPDFFEARTGVGGGGDGDDSGPGGGAGDDSGSGGQTGASVMRLAYSRDSLIQAPQTFVPSQRRAVSGSQLFRIRVHNGGYPQIGDIVGTDERGIIRKIETQQQQGLTPIGVIVRSPNQENIAVIRNFTVDETVQYPRVVERITTEGLPFQRQREQIERRGTEGPQLELHEQIEGHGMEQQLGISGRETITAAREAFETAIVPHLGKLHEHPRMQQDLNVPDDHVVVDKADWIEARLKEDQENRRE